MVGPLFTCGGKRAATLFTLFARSEERVVDPLYSGNDRVSLPERIHCPRQFELHLFTFGVSLLANRYVPHVLSNWYNQQ
jgi:hypothetical protein